MSLNSSFSWFLLTTNQNTLLAAFPSTAILDKNLRTKITKNNTLNVALAVA